ncbi:MAG: cysteine peptidase family C39 domain-containing protein [Mycoplasmoidaceae bacterium]|nr:cysteine peptidase family C39 domain-containing protein [Mycoplasmoidaceae bacterium]
MGLKIVTQTNEQECGVCALASIHNHYYKEQVVKEQVLNKCHISNNGLSIFDLETLGNKLGLECESYEVKYSEFINIKINNYFILLLATGCNKNHYVVAKKKKKKYLEIYDSYSSEMKKMTYEQLKSFYADIVILVKNKPNNLYKKAFGKATTLLMIDLKFVLLNLLLSMIILAISVGSASFLNYVIDLAINKSSINNLITICFIFVLLYLINNIFSFVSQIYMSHHTKAYFMLFTSKILSSLRNKNLTFINKVDKS